MIIKIRNGAAILIIIVNNYSLVRMEKVIMRNKIYNYLVILIFLELVLGGLGNLFGLPIRKGLFVVGILYTLYMIYADRIRIWGLVSSLYSCLWGINGCHQVLDRLCEKTRFYFLWEISDCVRDYPSYLCNV